MQEPTQEPNQEKEQEKELEKELEAWLKEWLEVYVQATHAPKTYACYADAVRRIFVRRPEWRTLLLSGIFESMIQELINSLAPTYAKSTLNHIRVVFKQAFSRAAANGIRANPLGKIAIPICAAERTVHSLTRREQISIEAAARLDPLGHLATFLLLTGLRPGELCGLTWADYDAGQSLIYIRHSKTKAGVRVVPLVPVARQLLEGQPHCCEHIFTSLLHTPLTKTVLRGLCNRLKIATGVEHLTPHVFRHCFATRLVEKGVQIKALATLMGHTSEYFTMRRYVTAEVDFLRNQIGLLDAAATNAS